MKGENIMRKGLSAILLLTLVAASVALMMTAIKGSGYVDVLAEEPDAE